MIKLTLHSPEACQRDAKRAGAQQRIWPVPVSKIRSEQARVYTRLTSRRDVQKATFFPSGPASIRSSALRSLRTRSQLVSSCKKKAYHIPLDSWHTAEDRYIGRLDSTLRLGDYSPAAYPFSVLRIASGKIGLTTRRRWTWSDETESQRHSSEIRRAINSSRYPC